MDTALGFLKSKLPALLADQVDSLVAGPGFGGIADATKGLGGLFGKS